MRPIGRARGEPREPGTYAARRDPEQVERLVIGADFGADDYTTVEQADELARRLELRAGLRLLDLGSDARRPRGPAGWCLVLAAASSFRPASPRSPSCRALRAAGRPPAAATAACSARPGSSSSTRSTAPPRTRHDPRGPRAARKPARRRPRRLRRRRRPPAAPHRHRRRNRDQQPGTSRGAGTVRGATRSVRTEPRHFASRRPLGPRCRSVAPDGVIIARWR
jgi:hypothetical protein